MAIELYRDIDAFVPTCDYCGDELRAHTFFDDAVAEKKEAGWRSFKDDETGNWTDMCPRCQQLLHRRSNIPRATAQMDFASIT